MALRISGIPVVDDSRNLVNVATANISSNVIIDEGTLFVDAVGNRVGVGITTPSSNLHVVGNANITLGINTSTVNATTVNATTLLITSANITTGNFTNLFANSATINGKLNVNNDLNVTGNIYLNGNTTYINVATYLVEDPLIYLAANNNLTDTVDMGFMGGKNTSGTYSHTGLVRDATDAKWKLFDGLPEEGHVNNIVNFANTYLATLVANVEANTLTVVNGVSGNVNFDSGTLFIDSVGNEIGIGTTNPTSNLHVVGNVNITSRMTVGGIAQSADYSVKTASGIETVSNSTSSGFGLSIIDAGNNSRYLRFQANVTGGNYLGTTSNDALILYSAGTSNTGALTIGPWTSHQFRYRQNASSNSHSLYGWVGLHTDTPNSNLTVVGNVWATTGINAATINVATANLTTIANTGAAGVTVIGTLNTATANITTIVTGNTLTLSTGTGSNSNVVISPNGSEKVRITNTGNIIIQRTGDGNQNLSYLSNATGHVFAFNHDPLNPKEIYFQANTANNWFAAPATGLPKFIFSVAGNDIFAITNTSVGIRTTNPTSNLHVVGNANITLGINTSTVNATTINAATIVNAFGANLSNAVLKTGDTMTGSLNFNFTGANSNFSIQNQNDLAVIEMGGANGAFIDMKSPNSDDFDFRIITIQGSTSFVSNNAAQVVAFSGANVNFDSGTLFVDSVANEVGIGTTNPTSNLHVVGTANLSAPSTTATSLTFGASAGQILRNENSEFAFGLHNASPFPLYIQGRNNTNAARDIVLNPSGGNLGIGTTNPTSNLHVVGNANISSTSILGSNVTIGSSAASTSNAQLHVIANRVATAYGLILGTFNGASFENDMFFRFTGTVGQIGNFQNFPLGFITNASERMRIDATGNVAIGSTNPAGYKLRVVGNSGTPQFRAGTDASGYLEVNAFDANPTYVLVAGSNTTAGAFGTQTNIPTAFFTNNTEKMRILADGNVAIGATSSAYKLYVNDTAVAGAGLYVTGGGQGNPIAKFERTVGATGSFVEINSSGNNPQIRYSRNGFNTVYWSIGVNGNNELKISNSDVDTNDRITIANTGNVGIGTTSPTSNLHVIGTANITSNLVVGGAITENTNGTFYNVATQFDIGTAPNQIPLNQYLGTMAFQDAAGIAVGEMSVSGNTNFDSGTLFVDTINNRIGISTITPTANLHVNGSSIFGGSVSSGRRIDVDSSGRAVFIYNDNTLVNQITLDNLDTNANTDHGSQILWRLATNASSTAINAGRISVAKQQVWSSTGSTQDAYMAFSTISDGNLSERMRITDVGNVGIGITGPTKKLHVLGSAIISDGSTPANNATLLVQDDGVANTVTSGATFRVANDGSGATFAVFEASSGVSNTVITNAGNMGIGTTTPSHRLHVYTTAAQSLRLQSEPAASPANLDASQFFEIIKNTAVSGLTFSAGDSRLLTGTITTDNEIVWRAAKVGLVAGDYITLKTNGGTERMRLDANGNVSIGTTSTTYKLEVNGSFAATTKSFVINHPTKPGKKLRYGSLEGPENGVYVRGKVTGNVIELPDYWVGLVDEESITVNLTPIGKHQKLFVEYIEGNRVYISNDSMFSSDINCYYTVFAERKDVDKLQVEY